MFPINFVFTDDTTSIILTWKDEDGNELEL